ncbi:phosphate ABC transporter, inner membrane subunit PstA [Ammonifex degensii KC4]|uniref:Phosphate transport system permease protein PstA n=1 Tax=Ammonifex degensii (strain DSM 10501 / KC4) TaxID=429009 RepID=C9RBH9_AMMDK|nr:phosphate ABC transporter permease PstA [Ammonifex degensii]ACX51606.1 phosphate ABC transporter, inner membrane subunit PstA [Ammonifex degensii KC4]
MTAHFKDRLATLAFWLAAGVVVAVLAFLLGYIMFHGFKVIDWKFLTSEPETIKAGGGIGPNIFNSFYLLFLSLIIVVPLGVLAGIYLSEYAKENALTRSIRLSIETLASLPSIVVGLFGLLLFVTALGLGYSLLAGALALTIINLPLMVRITEEALRTVPQDLREASLSLGATKWQTIYKVVLPTALPGLLTGIILASGRILGEAAALIFTAGLTTPRLNFSQWDITSPTCPWNPLRPGETLAVHIWKVNSEAIIPDVRRVADGSSAVLVIIVLLFNFLARWLARRASFRLTGQ